MDLLQSTLYDIHDDATVHTPFRPCRGSRKVCISLTQHGTAWAVTIPIRLQNLDGGQTRRHRVNVATANTARTGVTVPADDTRSFKLIALVCARVSVTNGAAYAV